MFAYFDTTLSWGELLKRTVKETQADNGLGLAAQLAYYFFLALFPTLLFLIALAGIFASPALVTRLVDLLGGTVPPDVIDIIRDQLISISQGSQGGIMTFGVLAALWSSSAAMVALIDALNRAYDVEDTRPWWKQRLTAILLTTGIAVFILVSFTLVVAGPQLSEWLAARIGLGSAFEWTWKIVQWPIVFALVSAAFCLIYYFAPDVDQDFVFLTPGSVVATLLWLVGSVAFRFYVVNFGSYNETYGAIGGIIVLLLWLYISGVCVIVGAEMNAEIEHASAHGKAPGEKTPGQRRTIGARAEREFHERQAGAQQPSVPPTHHALGTSMPSGYPTGDTHMATQDTSIVDVIKSAIRDARDLVQGEIALAKAEAREEVRRLGAGAALLGVAALAGLIGVGLLLTTIAWAIAETLRWPVWAGFGIVTVVTLIAAAVLAYFGWTRLQRQRHMPLTTDTLKENMEWMRARTS